MTTFSSHEPKPPWKSRTHTITLYYERTVPAIEMQSETAAAKFKKPAKKQPKLPLADRLRLRKEVSTIPLEPVFHNRSLRVRIASHHVPINPTIFLSCGPRSAKRTSVFQTQRMHPTASSPITLPSSLLPFDRIELQQQIKPRPHNGPYSRKQCQCQSRHGPKVVSLQLRPHALHPDHISHGRAESALEVRRQACDRG
jgi:hypothetical protein